MGRQRARRFHERFARCLTPHALTHDDRADLRPARRASTPSTRTRSRALEQAVAAVGAHRPRAGRGPSHRRPHLRRQPGGVRAASASCSRRSRCPSTPSPATTTAARTCAPRSRTTRASPRAGEFLDYAVDCGPVRVLNVDTSDRGRGRAARSARSGSAGSSASSSGSRRPDDPRDAPRAGRRRPRRVRRDRPRPGGPRRARELFERGPAPELIVTGHIHRAATAQIGARARSSSARRSTSRSSSTSGARDSSGWATTRPRSRSTSTAPTRGWSAT